MNKCPIFSGRDTEWSEWSFIFESLAGKAILEPAMEGAFKGLAEKPLADLPPGMTLSAKQLYCGQEQGVDPRQKRREASG